MAGIPNFTNQDLLIQALTHRSALNEHVSTSPQSNERLEFLGDAVLELATTQFLFDSFPEEQEGILTAYRSALVKTGMLAEVAKKIGLGEKLLLSKGEEAGGGRENRGLMADTFEAVLGALYLDQGYEAAVAFLEKHLFVRMPKILENKLYKDPKSLLQETVQSLGLPTPVYKVVSEDGPDHDKEFTVHALVGGQIRGTGQGKSKQEAQQSAATEALEEFA